MELIWAVENLTLLDVVDILIVALFFYGLTFIIRGTQAIALLRGMVLVLVGLILVSSVLELRALRWLLNNVFTVLAIAIPIIFQPELRRALERLGRGGLLINRHTPDQKRLVIIDEICQAAERLSDRRHGALIVLQRNSRLEEFVRTGIPLDSRLSSQILLTIFWPKTELHDGAAIISDNGRIASAASVLPLTANRNLPSRKMGTRHRAALGISEVSDALCVVVSEETGRIAITNGGRMVSRLDPERLKTILIAFYGPEQAQQTPLFERIRNWLRNRFDSRSERKPAIQPSGLRPSSSTLVSQLIWFLVSFGVASLVWVIAITQADPIVERRFMQVPVQMTPDDGLILVERTTRTVRVTLRAQQSVLNLLTNEDIVVRAELQGLGPGSHTVPLDVEVTRRAATDTQPRQITVVMEAVQSQQVPVTSHIEQEPSPNYTRSQPVFSQHQVVATGPASRVQQVVAAQAVINLADQRDALETEVRLVPVDSEGQIVDDVTLNPPGVGLTLTISRRDDVREVSVTPDIDITSLPSGYVVSSIGYDPQTVLVLVGPPDENRPALPTTLLTETIDLSGRTSNFEVTVPVVFPPDYMELPLLGEPLITVLVSISAQTSSRQFDGIPVQILGGEQLEVELVPDFVAVLVTGPQPVLETLEEDDIRVAVDLNELEPGTYDLTPIVSTRQLEIESSNIAVLPAIVTVIIEDESELFGTVPANTLP